MLGELSARYESNGDPGCISDGYGDPGGKSYGTYQFSSNAGSLQNYVNWLQRNNYWFGDELAKNDLTSDEFDRTWKFLAESGNRDDFEQSQHDYIKTAYYNPAVSDLADAGWNINNHSSVMRDVVWSRAVQYGSGYIVAMWQEAAEKLGYPNLSYVDSPEFDADMIKSIYLNVCSSWDWNHSALMDSLNDRYRSECEDALKEL
jgi:hypothetical protein